MLLQRFLQDQRANIAPLLALSIVPLVGVVGLAVDYSRAGAIKSSLQAAADSTALALSKNAASTNATDLSGVADKFFRAVYTRSDGQNLTVTASYSGTSGSKLVVTGTTTYAPMFAGVLALAGLTTPKDFTIVASSTSTWGNTRLRVALVLDNTGSMSSSGKITALKTATHNLLTQLQTAASKDGDVYVSIVPFAKDVNVGPSNHTQDWIDWSVWEAPPPDSTPSASVGPGSNCPYTTSSHGFQCTTGPATGSPTTSRIPSSGSYKGYICPSVDSGRLSSTRLGQYYNGCYTSTTYSCTGSSCSCTGHNNCSCSGSGSSRTCQTNAGYYEHTWVANDRSTWDGCVMDRDQNYDTQNTSPAAGALFPAQQYQYCNTAMVAQSFDWATLNAAVDAMSPAGSTNQTIGLVWGWQSLTQSAPLNAPALDANYKYQQVIILLTDGLNTQNRWYGNGSATSTQVDNRMRAACTNIKSAGITIYSVQVNTGGDPTSTLLQDCASNTSGTLDHFFLLTSADQIITTFNAIGTSLSKLRLAK